MPTRRGSWRWAARPGANLRARALACGIMLLLAACGAGAVSPSLAPTPSASGSPSVAASVEPAVGAIEPAPGSDSTVYGPNPGAIVVAIDAGHGGCLDWGVPDPSERGVDLAEKTLTLAIAQRLRDLLAAEGVGVIMVRDGDDALAGDDYAPLNCAGPPWRDVNGDGVSGFGHDVPEATRTRDELQARLDLANVAGADALVSIHINSPTEGGQRIEIAFSETFYTDETSWGTETARLAEAVQTGVVERLSALADYERGDRGTTAHNFYMVAPPLFEATPERPDPLKQPTRGGLMPVVLAEVGSITLRSEHDLLASAAGQDAVADGLLEGIEAFFADRELGVRIGLADAASGLAPEPVAGAGPPFWPPVKSDGPVELRLTNTGTVAWPSDIGLVASWETSDQPYLARAPETLEPLSVEVPALAPGASAVVSVELPQAPDGRALAWISLQTQGATAADRGSPALQLSSQAP